MRKAVLLIGLAALCGEVSAQVWVEITPAVGPAPREHASAIYDPIAHRMVVFGGTTATGDVNDVWAFDLAAETWTEITPALGPAPAGRFTQNALYDSVEHRMIIWSGQGTGVFLNDVWAFDLATHAWSEFTPPGPLPNIRYGTAAVFDPLERDLVTFAGFTDMGRFDDTWRFDVDLNAWTDVTPVSSPFRRCLHSANYDVINHRMIIYAGQTAGARDDIWAFDLATDTWADLTPVVRPAGRFFTAQQYDSARHRALIFGGSTNIGSTDEVWAFDLQTDSFSEIMPTGPGPAARYGAAAVYVVTEDRLIAFGGTSTAAENDVWSLEFSPSGGITFPWTILGDGDSFTWAVPANVAYVRGDLVSVSAYEFSLSGSETHATSITDAASPSPGSGYYYVVKLEGPDTSWQTAPGAETDRDATLP